MSDVQQESTKGSNPSALRSGLDWVAKHWPRVRLAHEGVMVDRVQRVQRIGEVLARNAMTGDMKDTKGWPGNEKGDDMGVAIGDTIHNHHYAPESKPELPKKPANTLAGQVGNAALAFVLLGAGYGIPKAVSWAMSKPEPPAAEVPTMTDTDTTRRVEVEVWHPGE